MKCPHCLVQFHDKPQSQGLVVDVDGGWHAVHQTCPACRRAIIHLLCGKPSYNEYRQLSGIVGNATKSIMAHPRGAVRAAPPETVPKELAEDYTEACLVIADSPKAAAALARRCLQHLLRSAAGVKPADLANEIQELLDRGSLPSHMSEAIDAIRNIGNFAAHPLKSQSSGAILPVEPGEAEWTLDVLDSFFDFYFVQPALLKRKKDALNSKLADAGKKPAK